MFQPTLWLNFHSNFYIAYEASMSGKTIQITIATCHTL